MVRTKSTAIPGPGGWLGLDARTALRARPIKWCEHLNRHFGDIVRFRVFGRLHFQITEPGLLREVLGSPEAVPARTVLSASYSLPHCQGLLSVLLSQQPTELPEIPEEAADQFASAIERRTRSRLNQECVRIFNVAELMFDVCLQPLVKMLLGPGDERAIPGLECLVRELIRTGRTPFANPPLLRKEYGAPFSQFLRDYQKPAPDRSVRESWYDRLLHQSIRCGRPGNANGNSSRDIALAGLVQAIHSFTHLASRAIYLLATHPVEQLAVQSDLLEHRRRSPAPDSGRFNPELADCALLESARLFPPFYLLALEVPETLDVAGLVIPGKSICIVPVWLLHRNQAVFPMPEDFRLSRFSERNGAPAQSMIPFGPGREGPFLQKPAMMAAAAGLRAILATWQLELIEERGKTGFLPLISAGLSHGPYIQFRRRR